MSNSPLSPIPLSVPNIAGDEWLLVKECLDTGWVSTAGHYVAQFEEHVARYTGAKHAVATTSGTAALHLALHSLGVDESCEVLTPTITFAATANAVRYCGAHPVFFDCDDYFNLDIDAIGRFLTDECDLTNSGVINKASGRKVWGILPVHVFGNPVDMSRLMALADRFRLRVVEDAAESLGSFHDGKHTGTFGICGCLSFNGNKIITTGGGGMILTNDTALATRLRYLSTQAKDDPIQFLHHEIGFNYRLTSVQAALGIAQMRLLPRFLDHKRATHTRYRELLANVPGIRMHSAPPYGTANHWLNNVTLSAPKRSTPLQAVAFLKELGIEARPVWYPNHAQKAHLGAQAYQIQRAERIVASTLSIPSSTTLSESDISRVVTALKQLP